MMRSMVLLPADAANRNARIKKIVGKVILYAVMTIVAIVMIMPFYYSVITSFRTEIDIQYNPVRFWPEQWKWSNYKTFFDTMSRYGTPVFKILGNTLVITISIIIFNLFFCSLAAYSLARLNYRGKKVIERIMYASMMIPGVVSLVPLYSIVSSLGLKGGKLGVIVPAMYSIYGVLFLRSFFVSTPKEIAEAARIDGAGELRIFFQYLKMIVPGLITLGLFTFNGNWNSYLWPKIILTKKAEYTLAITIKEFQIYLSPTDYGTIMAAALITVVPTILIFVVGQKFFMDNLTFTGIK